jgi:hypothetical protein
MFFRRFLKSQQEKKTTWYKMNKGYKLSISKREFQMRNEQEKMFNY